MRSLFTALAFLAILLAVLPAVRRCRYPVPPRRETDEKG
ncbi:MAG: hypothetical protein KatS3mg131_1757 [Candidatus Tectimicrobiota bacterium]|nr:MAG: hypothetical protein KatS3mg131_1757 [Candidatus Tectomicrobia bacterium]